MTAINKLQFIIFVSNIFSGFSYFVLVSVFLTVLRKFKAVHYLFKSEDKVAKEIVFIVGFFQLIFALIISLCGLTHIISAVEYISHDSSFIILKCSILVIFSVITFLTAILSLNIFPFIRTLLNQYQLTNEGAVRLIAALERMQKSIVILSTDLRLIKGSEMTAVYFGQNYLGRSIFEVITNEDDVHKFQNAFQKIATDEQFNEPVSVQFKIQDNNGNNAVWLESKIRRDEIVSTDGSIEFEYTIITRNIDTEKKNEILQKTLEDARLQEIVNQSKLMYITSVAHDLKAPLQTFCFGLELILRTTLTFTQKDIIKQLSVASEMMKLSISQSIDIGKTLDGRMLAPRNSTVSLAEIIDQVKMIMNGNFTSVPIFYNISSFIEDNIITDREWLWQMLLNLLTNACKYTIEGSITVTVDLAANKTLLFQVIDTGIGITDSKKKTIFDAFNQAQIGQVTGTGLGLYGLRCRVEALGGVCGVKDNEKSESGSGSIFWFQIPYRIADKEDDENRSDYDDMEMVEVSSDYDSIDDFIDSTNNTMTKSSKSDPTSSKSNSTLSLQFGKKSDNTIYCSAPQIISLLSSSSTSPRQNEGNNHSTNELIPDTSNPLANSSTSTTTASFSQFNSGKITPYISLTHKSSGRTMETVSARSSQKADKKSFLDATSPTTPFITEQDHHVMMNSLIFVVPPQIYLIDDSLTILKMTSMTLHNLGFTNIECFENGYAGLQAMKKKYVDIVFTDVQMPVLTGPEMAQRFREFEKKLRTTGERKKKQIIIALTANASEELCAMVPEVFDHICTKPINSLDLMDIMRTFCRNKELDEMV